MFIESSWQDSVVALLVAINALAGAGDRTAPLRPFGVDDVVAIALSLENRSYRPERWFTQGAALQPPIGRSAPPIADVGEYMVVVRAVEPAGLQHISKTSG